MRWRNHSNAVIKCLVVCDTQMGKKCTQSSPYAGKSFILRLMTLWRQEAPLLHIPSASQYTETIRSPSLLCQAFKTTIIKAKWEDEKALGSALTSLLNSHSL